MSNTASHRPHTILLAEEHAVSRDLINLVLGKLNYEIDQVATSEAALERIRTSDHALALLSATLPHQAPAAVIQAAHELRPENRLPFLVIAPEPDHESSAACLEVGAVECLVRPVEIERLLRLVERLVRAQTTCAPEEPIIDLDHLRGFTDGDVQLEDELSTLYLSTANVYLERMRDALEGAQPWDSVAHALKGASANLGARRVSSLALGAERSPPSKGQLDALHQAVEDVRQFFDTR